MRALAFIALVPAAMGVAWIGVRWGDRRATWFARVTDGEGS